LTPEGNYQLARVIAEELSAVLPSDPAGVAADVWADEAECDRRLALTQFDRQRLGREMIQRISVAPFTSQSSHAANVRHAQARLQEILSHVTPESPKSDRALYEEALTRAPNDNLLHANFAQFLDATGAKEEAIVQGQRVCELLPDLSWPYYYVGALMVQAGRPAEAADYFERALEIRDDFPEARVALDRLRMSLL
jgi:tetratricopeptide (TPR) repeat protein